MPNLPAGRIIEIKFEFRLPVDATNEEIAEWVSFATGSGTISLANPLYGRLLEYWDKRPVLTDTFTQGREVETNRRALPGGVTVVDVQYVRERATN
jgi:hypothetical protein